MEWLEKQPLPQACVRCKQADCYNCDQAGNRWYLSSEDLLKTRRKMLLKAIERLQRQVQAIDEELAHTTLLPRGGNPLPTSLCSATFPKGEGFTGDS